mmetsp:Transcript_23615/g.54663  ORF Transcript_23615/g.54663 Transcript_23615/m.54663 type:complete len:242 (-) Transcript_23615:2367-3092(-)
MGLCTGSRTGQSTTSCSTSSPPGPNLAPARQAAASTHLHGALFRQRRRAAVARYRVTAGCACRWMCSASTHQSPKCALGSRDTFAPSSTTTHFRCCSARSSGSRLRVWPGCQPRTFRCSPSQRRERGRCACLCRCPPGRAARHVRPLALLARCGSRCFGRKTCVSSGLPNPKAAVAVRVGAMPPTPTFGARSFRSPSCHCAAGLGVRSALCRSRCFGSTRLATSATLPSVRSGTLANRTHR